MPGNRHGGSNPSLSANFLEAPAKPAGAFSCTGLRGRRSPDWGVRWLTITVPEPELSQQERLRQDLGLGGILFLLVGGAVIGILGKMVAPGDRDKIPFWLTVLCGNS